MDVDIDDIERQIHLGVSAARVTYEASLSAGRSADAAFSSAKEAMLEAIGPDIEVADLDDFLASALDYESGDDQHTIH